MELEGCGHNRQGWQSLQAQGTTNHNSFLAMGMASRQEHIQTMIFTENHGGITGKSRKITGVWQGMEGTHERLWVPVCLHGPLS